VSENCDPFNDLTALRIDPADPKLRFKNAPAKKATKWKKHFIRVPWSWVERLRDAHHVCTWKLAMYLLYEHWRNGGQVIVLSNAALVAEGITRHRKWEGVRELEQLGLVTIHRRPRKSPLVAVLADRRTGKP
jgi:hypothetical protein